jgi:hypothetical protein
LEFLIRIIRARLNEGEAIRRHSRVLFEPPENTDGIRNEVVVVEYQNQTFEAILGTPILLYVLYVCLAYTPICKNTPIFEAI